MNLSILLLSLSAVSSVSGFATVGPQRMPMTRPSNTLRAAYTLDEMGSAVDTFYQTQPYLSAFLTCSVKASAADFVAQTKANEDATEDDAAVDFQRNLAFILYGGLYQGMAQQFLYTGLFPAWFGTEITLQNIATQVSVDMFVHGPFLCLPMAYVAKAVLGSGIDSFSMEKVQETMAKYVEDVMERGLLLKFWAIWIPAQAFNFAMVPEHFRIAFIACISFFWMMILSATSNATSKESEKVSIPSLPPPPQAQVLNTELPTTSNATV